MLNFYWLALCFIGAFLNAASSIAAETLAPRIISKAEKAGTYQAFPDVCRLASGELLCVFYAGYAHISLPRADWPAGGRICSVRSSDEGRTWSAAEILYDSADDDRDPHIAQMKDGSLVCSFFPYRGTNGANADFEASIIRSPDGGKTWEKKHHVLARHWACSAPVREMPNGIQLLGVYREDGHTAYGGVLRSNDSGRTWSDPIPIDPNSVIRLDAETDLILLKDGTLYAALRGDRVNMHYATSSDFGQTWSPVKDIGFKGHCPHLTRHLSGAILLSHRLPQTALHISFDEAKSWLGPFQIDDKIGAYPSTVELRDGTVLIVYYEEGINSAIRARKLKITRTGIEFVRW
jgi:sialidase-1